MKFYFILLTLFIIIDISIYRIFKKNFLINKIKISLPLFLITLLIIYFYHDNDLKLIILIFTNYFLIIVFYHLIFLGIKQTSPSLFILNEIKGGNFLHSNIKIKFLNKNSFYNRVKENLRLGLIKKNKKNLVIQKKGKNILKIFNSFKTILKI